MQLLQHNHMHTNIQSWRIWSKRIKSLWHVWCVLCRKALRTQTGCLYAHDRTYCKNFKFYVRMYQHCSNCSIHVVFCACCSINFVILTVQFNIIRKRLMSWSCVYLCIRISLKMAVLSSKHVGGYILVYDF